MQELKKKTTDRTVELSGRSVTLFIESQFIVLSGNWDWDMNSEAVFCSDVILSFPYDFTGTKALIHPEDKEILQNQLFTSQEISKIKFRVITTYGEIKTLCGNQLTLTLDDNSVLSWHEEILRKVEEERDLPHLLTLRELYQNFEYDLNAGTWYHNKSTNETWYSAQVFRIFDLAPFSLNANLNTFNPFIHPEEKDTVTEYFHQAYKKQAPFHIDYRIQTSRTEKKIRLIMRWIYSPSGENICCGTYHNISEQKNWEDLAQKNDEKADFNRQVLALDEQQAGLGHWNIDLVTRKVQFSDNLYRLFGLKPHSFPPVMNSLFNYIHPSDRELFEISIRGIFQDRKPPDIEFRIIRTDNKTRYFQQKARIISNGNSFIMSGVIQDITIQKLLERKVLAHVELNSLHEAVRKQEEEISKTGSWEWNLKTGKIEWNTNFFSLLGLRENIREFSLQQLMLYIHPEDQAKFLDSVSLVTKEKQEPEFSFRMVIRGRLYFMKAFFRIFRDEHKEIFIGTIQDVSLYHILQKEVNEKLQVTEAIAENLEDKVIIIDQDNMVVMWNQQSELGFGIKKELALGKNIFDLLPGFQTEEILCYYQRVLKGETITVNEMNLFSRGHFQLKLVPLAKEFSSEVTGIIHLIRDVTREYELRKNLNERLSFIENIVESSVDQIIALDKNLNFVIWNRQCEKQYGLNKEDVIGKNILDIFPSSKNTPAFEDFRRALRGEKVHIPANPGSGKDLYNEVYLLPVKNERDEIIAVLWILHDLSKEYDLNLQRLKVNSILESLNEGYFELDHDLYFIKVNKISEDFFHKKKEEMMGKKFTEVFPHASREVLATMYKTLETGLQHQGEFYSNITDRWVYISISPTVEGIAVVFFDLQRIKDAEKLVQENEYLLQQINKATPDAITIFNIIEKQPIYLNNCLAEWTGISSEELIAMGHEGRLLLIHPEDRTSLISFNETLQTAKDGEVSTLDYRIVSKGKTLWLRNRSKVFKRNSDGTPTHFLTILQDITREKQLVKEIQERSIYAESIINSSIDQIIVLDREFNVIAINEKAELILKLKKEDAIGKNFFFIFPKLKEEPVIWNAFQEALSGKLVQLAPRKAIYSNNINERFYLPVKNENGEVYAIVNVVHDVTELVNKTEKLKELNEILKIRNKELQQKNEEITNFSFVASHDMKEPLRKIHTFSDWLVEKEKDHLSSTGIDYLHKLQSSVRRMERLIEDIQVLMKVHSDTQNLQEVDLSQLLNEVINDLEETYTDFEIDTPSLPSLTGNRNQLFLLCRNLIQNAIKFRYSGTKARINISSRVIPAEEKNVNQNRAYLCLSFADQGPGIHEKYFKKIFKVFQQLPGEHGFSGTGMGLAICRKIMENHGGHIKVESEEGKGTVFQCYFPLPDKYFTVES